MFSGLKQKIIYLISFLSFIAATGIAYNNCGGQFKVLGTDTGNPGMFNTIADPSINIDDPASPHFNPLETLPHNICQKLATCNGGTLQTCNNSLLSSSDFLIGLGVNTSLFPTYNDLINTSETNEIPIENDSYSKCLTTIKMLDCSSVHIVNSIDPMNANNFLYAHKILDADLRCKSIFP